MFTKFVLGHHSIDLNNDERKTLELFYKSGTNYRKCLTTGSKELFFVYSKDWDGIPPHIQSLTDKGILIRYSFDAINLYLVDNNIGNYKDIRTEKDFKEIFNDTWLTFSSFNNFVSTLRDKVGLFKYYAFYRMNKDLVKKLFYEHMHKDDNCYAEDFYSSTQEFVDDNVLTSDTDIVGEIKTKQFQKYGNIRKYT